MKPPAVFARFFELLRYSAVGLICFVTTNAILAVLHELTHMPYAPAYVCAFLGATAIGYILHARFTFAGASLQAASPGRYLLVSATMLGITSLQFLLLVDIFHVWYIAASVSLAALNIPVNFLVHRRVSYGLRYSAADPPPA